MLIEDNRLSIKEIKNINKIMLQQNKKISLTRKLDKIRKIVERLLVESEVMWHVKGIKHFKFFKG